MTPKRIQMTRQRPWRADNPAAVIVARPSRWGNPFPVADFGAELAVRLYANSARGYWLPSLVANLSDEEFDRFYNAHQAWSKRIGGHPTDVARSELAGRDLACWCPLDQPCHADVLLVLANGG